MNTISRLLKRLSVFSACLFLLFCSTQPIYAELLPQRGPIPFNIYDIDSNGSISQDEFNTRIGQRMESRAAQGFPMRNMASEPNFNQFDSDKDGQLNREELAKGQQQQMQQRRKMRQGQNKGMAGARNMPRFEDFDQNKDGVLTPDEFNIGMQQHIQQRRNMRQGQRMRMRQQGQQQGQRGMNRRNQPRFEDFDGNKDGYISEQELIEARSMRISNRIQQGYQMRNTGNITQFNEIDKNSDGKISPEEFTEQQKQHQIGRPRPQ
ncbi:MAG: EF-hand domain-containing protein [gamma proteobacterium symbiont of Bathyaustriella thionipta]|nr:EF-hand domain-containing protein [gamma proteobacterium symbiont of Bathyaustriella thionipta]MCU7951452.1 EF-hand domain-containing protein [gamma proteobacterium symbiont of Bathyaustriella thionipta]MCU7953630.1 EF-hand domain-containing protein [gamma proteobacterium symbiont of Bathyaustriella thionipta]MCU7958020.1 EF-hand domain-containing protein [gamma proteobacterium symbiont of Bathyaustriella thionipta]MCU7967633.1 EF-hand domain-containing protein [gamma proteobacterium symbion